jgi:hypothetical protein
MSEVKVNKISPRTNCGTVTLGDSGDTFTIPAGATITNNGTAAGFGATGAASWDTTVKTSGFTAVSGVGYFVNTTGGAISVNLPAGSAGDVVAIKDYAGTFNTNAVTLVQNGSDKIGGSTNNATLGTEGIAVTLVFVDATQGWLVTDDGLQSQAVTNPNIIATGGTITTCGNFKIHTFTGPGTFTVCKVSCTAANNTVGYQVVAGGGGGGGGNGGSWAGGGGGAGGYREGRNVPVDNFTASPLVANAPTNAITVTVGAIPITVGAGGAGSACTGTTPGTQGATSTFSSITSAGGGGGGASAGPGSAGGTGGSGGGGGSSCSACRPGGAGNTPPVSPAQGFAGGNSSNGHQPASGGGGATAVGTNSTPGSGNPRAGGAGATSSISGSPVTKSVGGASGNHPNPSPVADGGANTGTGGQGNGGSGGSSPRAGGTGGSGIVVIRYKFQ